MPTAKKVVDKAMSLIGVKVSGNDLTDDEYTDSIETMNDLMSELSSRSINIGYQKCETKTDETLLPDWAEAMVKANLAVRLAPEYSRPISQGLAIFATESLANVMNREYGEIKVQFPDTLPVGENSYDYDVGQYFTDDTLDDLENGIGEGLATGEGTQIEIED